jgi:hypothetical protein
MAYAHGTNLCDDDGRTLAQFATHWEACAALIRLSDPAFRSLGGDRPEALEIERGIADRRQKEPSA